MKQITFKYDLGQQVRTFFGDGVIAMQANDDGGVKYYVELENNGKWLKEEVLTAA